MRFTRIVLSLFAVLLAGQAHAADLWRPEGQPAFVDQNGEPYASGKLCYYDATTTDQKTVYKDAAEASPWAQPITLNSAGGLADPIYMPTGAFKEVFLDDDATTCDDGTTLFTSDSIPGAFDVTSLSADYAKPEQPAISKATDYTVQTTDLGSIINVNAAGGVATITLPTALDAGNGGQILVRKVDLSSNTVIINVVGAATIDGQSSITLSSQYDRMAIGSDGATWYTVSGIVDGTVTFAKFAAAAYDTDITLTANSNTAFSTQRAVKTYIDTAVTSGVKWKDPVAAATTANGTITTAFDNASVIDGITLATGDRILIKNQTDQTVNGIYVVQASGSPVRSTDADANSEVPGATVFITAGTVNANTQYTCTNTAVTLATTNITFSLIAAGVVYTADGTTLQLTGSQFAVKSGGIGATQIATNGVGTDEIATSAVDSAEIATDAVGTAEIAADAVGASEIATGAVGTLEIATNGVDTAEIAASAVDSSEIAAAAVDTSELSTTVEAKLRDVGEVITFSGATCPAQSREANGAAVSRSTYSAYFAIVAEIYGQGDNSTTFNLPDYRGTFLRGWDHAEGNDPDRATRTAQATGGTTGDNVGSEQAEATLAHTHADTLAAPAHTHTFSNTSGVESVGHTHTFSDTSTGHSVTHTHSFSDTDGGTFLSSATLNESSNGVANGSSFDALSDGTSLSTGTGTASVSGTTGNASIDHTHDVSGTTAAASATHVHAVSGTTAAASATALTGSVTTTAGSETRPFNVNVLYCIFVGA